MFPAYGYTKHSYPQGIPRQMKMEASNSPFMYETWPHHYGYPVPTQCHSCCNPNPYPSYYPYTYSPPCPLNPQFYGGYPVYPEPYSFHYPPPPPPQYTTEIPKYEYDKSHCCGCSHFKPDMSGDKGVKIVEQGSDSVNDEDSLVPSKQDSKGVGEEPKLWSGLMPLDMDNLKRLLQNGNFNPAVVDEVKKPPRTIPVKQMDESADMKTKNVEFEGDKKSTEKSTKRLPPICLRVDPLPKRKNGQGKSRSPSPPGDKVKPVEVVKPSSSIAEKDLIKPEKKILSGNEAATIIQSAYRGYEVRRWEPLKKMRQIANIREEAAVLKRRIESSANSMDLKQKIALGETIMNFLLKLDTVQGLHSSIRDIRKSVAKELVSLQEMLDTIVIKPVEVGPDINQAEAKADANESSLSSSADSFTEQNESDILEEAVIKNVAEEASIKPVDQEPSPAVSDMNHDLLYELQESDEASKGEVIIEQDDVSATPDKVETPFEIDDQAAQNDSSDQGALEMEENTKDQISSLHEPSDILEEASIKNVAEEASIKLVNQELDQLPVAPVMEEEDLPKTLMNHDLLDQESDEASKGEVIIEQDVVTSTPDKVETPFEVDDQAKGNRFVESEVDDEEDAKLDEEEVKLAIPSTENIVKEENEKMGDLLEKLIASGKEQQQVIWNLNEKLRELEDKLAKQKKKKKKGGSRTRKARVLMNGSSKVQR